MIFASSEWTWWLWQSPADLFETWRWLDWPLRSILLVLMVMLTHTVLMTAIMTARHAIATSQSRRFRREMKGLIDSGRLEQVLAFKGTFKRSHIAAVTLAGLREFWSTPSALRTEEARACAERAMERAASMRLAEMRVGLGTLKTIGKTAPLFGMFGMLLGVLNSFRGGSCSLWCWLMFYVGSYSIALLFTGLGLLVAVFSTWTYNCLLIKSNTFEREMKNAAAATMTQLGARPEFRGTVVSEASFDWDDLTRPRAWEVPYDRHGAVLVSVWAFVLFFMYILLGGVARPLNTDSLVVTLLLLLLVGGIMALSIWHSRRCVAAGGDSLTAERRRKMRLPLWERFASLPDRSVFTLPFAAALAVMMVINALSSRVSHGIPVELAFPSTPQEMTVGAERPVVLRVRKKPGREERPVLLLSFQGKVVNESELRVELRNELALRKERIVVVDADRELRFQTVADVMDMVNEIGGTPVLLGSKAERR